MSNNKKEDVSLGSALVISGFVLCLDKAANLVGLWVTGGAVWTSETIPVFASLVASGIVAVVGLFIYRSAQKKKK